MTTTQETDFTADRTRPAAAITGTNSNSNSNDFQASYGSADHRQYEEFNGTAPPPPPQSALRSSSDTRPAVKVRALAPDLLRGLLMVIMAMDHVIAVLQVFPHGQGQEAETDGAVVRGWTQPMGYVIRSFTHLCATGFTFLLGMGVVYFGNSRSKLGWSGLRMVRHFAIRAFVLTALCVFLGLLFTAGQIWFLNPVLFSLGIDYLIAGMVWIAVSVTEPLLAEAVSPLYSQVTSGGREEDDEAASRPLLGESWEQAGMDNGATWASSVSWHVHNGLLLILAVASMWINVWASPNHGHCMDESVGMGDFSSYPALRIWLYEVVTQHVASMFPPLAWLAPAFFGLIYGRVLTAKKWQPPSIQLGTLVAALLFALLFVFTRVFQFGNLTQACLRTPEHLAHPNRNQYLVNGWSFFYVAKYPPDVGFLAYTMAGNLLLLVGLESIPVRISQRFTLLLTYGTSALFFYIVHQFVIFGGGAILVSMFGEELGGTNPITGGPNRGIKNVGAFWGLWLLCLVLLYPLCLWYGRFKSRKGPDSIWRFF